VCSCIAVVLSLVKWFYVSVQLWEIVNGMNGANSNKSCGVEGMNAFKRTNERTNERTNVGRRRRRRRRRRSLPHPTPTPTPTSVLKVVRGWWRMTDCQDGTGGATQDTEPRNRQEKRRGKGRMKMQMKMAGFDVHSRTDSTQRRETERRSSESQGSVAACLCTATCR